MKVYISVGTPTNQVQKDFLDKLISTLKLRGLDPIVYAYNVSSFGDGPLASIHELISQSCGMIVIAYEKYHLEKATEFKTDFTKSAIDNKYFSTSWNQIETGLAFSKGLKPLVLVEKGVHQSGLLEPGHPWYIHTFDINQELHTNNKVMMDMETWIKDVKKVHEEKKRVPKKLDGNSRAKDIWDWFWDLKAMEQMKIVSGVLTFLGAVFSLGVANSSFGKQIFAFFK